MDAKWTDRIRTKLRVTGSSSLALSIVFTSALRIVSTMCLTRLLSPDVYGVVGIILSIFYMVNMLTDIGLQSYVIRHERSDDPDFLNSVYTIHAVRGVILAAISMALAWPISTIMAKPQLFAPLLVSSLIFVIDGQVSLHQFRGLRDGKVQRYATMDLLSNVSQTVAAIVLAFILRNVWAIVGSLFVASTVRAWATYALFPGGRHRFLRDRAVASDLWRFSRMIAISSSLMLLVNQFDKLTLGRILSLNEFGLYVLAANLAVAPVGFASNYASTIVYPIVASAVRDGRSIADAYYSCWRRYFYLYAFAGGGLIGGADLLVRLLYDPRYVSVAKYLSILAINSVLIMTTLSMANIEIARGRPRFAVEVNIVRLACLIVGAFVALLRNNAWVLVIAIGLVELSAYVYSAWWLSRIRVIRPLRELSLFATILAGFAAGAFASQLGRVLLPNL